MAEARPYVWCTYRTWSFQVLEAIQDLPGWRCALVVTTEDCVHDFGPLEARGVPVLRAEPRTVFTAGGAGLERLRAIGPQAAFHYGWSWLVPPPVLALCPNVTLHPGKLPRDRGGSPLQNQIRAGADWTYANVMELAEGLDEGPVYLRERISLAGDIEAVWARMVATGSVLTRRFLEGLAAGDLEPTPQADEEPVVHRRVAPGAEVLHPREQAARAMYDIVRAHAETDPNTYVLPASIRIGEHCLRATRAQLSAPGSAEVVEPSAVTDAHALCRDVNEGTHALVLTGADGARVYLTRLRVGYAS